MQTIPGWSPFSVLDDRQSHTIYSILAPVSEGDFHFLVEWDEDRDPRVLGAALALYYRRPDLFEYVLVWRERKAHLTVQVLPRVLMRHGISGRILSREELEANRTPQPVPIPVMSSAEIEVKRALADIVSKKSTYAVCHDVWEVETERITWPPATDDALAGIHRLYRLGPQRPVSVPTEIRAVPGVGVVVTYATDGKASRTGGSPGRVFQESFGTLEEATTAPMPAEAALARIVVIGGSLVREKNADWEFRTQE